MFKELKVIKLLVFVGLLVAILLRVDFLNLTIYQLYTDKLSYQSGDVVQIYGSSKAKYPVFANAPITDLDGNALDEVKLNLVQSDKKFEEVLSQGEDLKDFVSLKLDDRFVAGIYTVADQYPIVVSGKQADITFVYPHLNNLLYQKVEEENCMSINTPATNFKRSAEVDKFTKGLSEVFDYSRSKYSVNFITDVELEDMERISGTKLLVIYGKSTFWTPKMKDSFKKYFANGGNVLLISSYALNNVCWYDSQEKHVQLYQPKKAKSIESYLGYDGDAPRFSIGTSYLYGGKAASKTYTILKKNHPILSGVEQLELESKLYNSPPPEWEGSRPKIMLLDSLTYRHEIIAFGETETTYGAKGMKGLFEYQSRKESGKMINLGSEDWCLANDKTLIKNSIDYLLKESIK